MQELVHVKRIAGRPILLPRAFRARAKILLPRAFPGQSVVAGGGARVLQAVLHQLCNGLDEHRGDRIA
eukprot:COSAG06_NODE_59_length_27189_cov_21.724527_17_plen_68_part_00